MIPSLSLVQLIFLLPVALIAFVSITAVLIPYTKLQLFKKKGMTWFFFPTLGYLRNWALGYKDNGDCFSRFKRASQTNPDDRVLLSHLGNDPLILLRDSELIKDYFRKHHYYKKVGLPDYLRPLFGLGLLFAEGDMWKHHRKIISSSFHYEAIKSQVGLVQATTKEFLNKIDSKGMHDYAVINKIQEITGEIVGRIFFGEHLNDYSLDNKPLTTYLTDLITDLFVLSLSPMGLLLGPNLVRLTPNHIKLMKRIKQFRELCHKIIADRKAQEGDKGNDLLATLLATQTHGADPDDMMSDDDIVNQFVTFFAGGMDTTRHLIGITLYLLTQHPEYLERLKKERELYSHAGASLDNINKMEELHCFLKETLRFYTPIPLSMDRAAISDHKIGDLDIPKGMWVKPDYFAMAFHEKHWTEPEKFNPQRWKGDTAKVDPYAYIPFSGGPRNCIGQHLAMMEAKIIICEFLENFDFKLKDGYCFRMVYRFLYEPENELLFDLKPRAIV